MEDTILKKTLLFIRNKNVYTAEERAIIKKSLLAEAETILVKLIDKINVD